MKFFMDHVASQDWAARRRIIILSLIWIASLITFLAVWGRPIALSDTIALNLIMLFGGIIGSYVFGAIWDTRNKLKADVTQQAVDQAGSVNADVEIKP